MGNWLLHNGEAIYDSKPWKYQNDTKTLNIWYTSGSVTKDSNNRTIVYAIILNYPYDSDGVKLYSLGGIYDNSTRVNMLGIPGDLKVIATYNQFIPYNFIKNIFVFFIFHISGTDLKNQCTSFSQPKHKSINCV